MSKALPPPDWLYELQVCLKEVPGKELVGSNKDKVIKQLATCWNQLSGSSESGMQASKLNGERVEKLQWDPPSFLRFDIERHGAFTLGSTRAEVQSWWVDVISGTASIAHVGCRQLVPRDARLDVNAIAKEIGALIKDGKQDDRINWVSERKVRIMMEKVIPSTNKQTTAGRRRRFTGELVELMYFQGWQKIPNGTWLIFERTAS